MDRTELVKGLAVLGCAFIDEKGMTAVQVAMFAKASGMAFKLSHNEQTQLIQRMIDSCLRKCRHQE